MTADARHRLLRRVMRGGQPSLPLSEHADSLLCVANDTWR
jgi:hypothetical protein